MLKIFSFLTLILTTQVFARGTAREGLFVHDPHGNFLKVWNKNAELTVDHRTKSGYELYGPSGLKQYLEYLGVDFSDSLEEARSNNKSFASYPSPSDITTLLKKLAKENSDLIKLVSIGTSREGRELWFIKISDNPQTDEAEPEVKYVANMHGNEIVGRELMILLIEDLIASYRSGDQEITKLINNTEIWIMPSMNPDGANKKRRGNATWSDLNRDFPDFTTQDNDNSPEGREPETRALMNFQTSRNFALSANFHGGTKCVNYPWDTTASDFPLLQLVTKLSLEYASIVPGFYDSDEFENGIVNGYKWYEVNGGMQDWSYHWFDDLQVTIELSHTKWPDYSSIQQYYKDNRASLIKFLSRVHQGSGIKFADSNREGTVKVIAKDPQQTVIGTYGFSKGEFYKVLPEGKYKFEITSKGGIKQDLNVRVQSNDIHSNGNFTRL